MTINQKIERSRNRRLWIGQIIIPVVTSAVVVATTCPQLVEKIADKGTELKVKVQSKIAARKLKKKNKKVGYQVDWDKSIQAATELADTLEKKERGMYRAFFKELDQETGEY